MLQVVVDQCEPWSGRKIDLQIDPVYLPCTEEARALIQVSSHWSRLTTLSSDWSGGHGAPARAGHPRPALGLPLAGREECVPQAPGRGPQVREIFLIISLISPTYFS